MFASRLQPLGQVRLPDFGGVRVQMMPVVIGDPDSLPPELDAYRPLYVELADAFPHFNGEVGYLTVDERVTQAGQSQRRGGMHVDAGTITPDALWANHGGGGGFGRHGGGGGFSHGGGGGGFGRHGGGGGFSTPSRPRAPVTRRQPSAPVAPPRAPEPPAADPFNHRRRGLDVMSEQPMGTGMLTVASHVGCRAWNQVFDGWPGAEGDCSHLAEQANRDAEQILLPGGLFWLDTLCVHESIPVVADTPRQFVRLSMPSEAPWYEGYTVNPLGIRPTGPVLPRRKQMDA